MSSERGRPDVLAPPSGYLPKTIWAHPETGITIPFVIREHLFACGRFSIADAIEIIQSATTIFNDEPNVLSLQDPITVCGDIHGQFYDLMTLFKLGGEPGDTSDSTQYLFLGDYVDRGCFSTEVALYLFSLKIAYPRNVWMLRGNHECRHLTAYFNFKEECLHKYNEAVYDAFQIAFDGLPLAAVLNDSYLCVHGGLSPDVKAVDDISLIDRFREPPTNGAMCDLLWADPMEDEEEQLCPEALFLHNELRGCSYVFSFAAVKFFLEENNLLGVIRAHEAQDEGFRMFRKIDATGFPGVTCIFSAPNYCDSYDNKACILQISDKVLHLRQFHSVEHPYVLPNFMNAFTWSLPFVFDKVGDIVSGIAGLNKASGPHSYTRDEGSDDSSSYRGGNSRASSSSVNHATDSGGEATDVQNQHDAPTAVDESLIILLRRMELMNQLFRRRGKIMQIKVLAVARFVVLFKRTRLRRNSAAAS